MILLKLFQDLRKPYHTHEKLFVVNAKEPERKNEQNQRNVLSVMVLDRFVEELRLFSGLWNKQEFVMYAREPERLSRINALSAMGNDERVRKSKKKSIYQQESMME